MLDVYELAMLPIVHLVSQADPFERYCGQTGELTDDYRELVNNGIRGYQLYIYQVLIGFYFGEETRQQIRSCQLAVFNPEVLEKTLDVIEVALGTRGIKVSADSGDIQVPVEMNVALTLLLDMPCSPDYVPDPSLRYARIVSMGMGIDWQLADCLASAREEMINTWSAILGQYNA